MTDKATDDFVEWVGKMTEACQAFSEAIITMARLISERTIPVIQQMYDTWYKYYLAIGAPYGKSKRGFNKWLKSIQIYEEEEQKDEK